MPKILHQSTGLTIKKNDKNSFAVCTLFFFADPAKRSKQWEKEAAAGLPDAKFRKEYWIDYTAMFGERVFPELQKHKGKIICKSPFMDGGIPKELACWGGFDYGTTNPASFHVYTIYDGITYCIWELYEPCKNIYDFTDKMKSCPYWEQIRYIAADPDIFGLKTRNMKTGLVTSVALQFAECGISKFIPGNQDEDSFIAEMRQHWSKPDPTFKIFHSCPMIIKEFEEILYRSMTERQLQTANYAEEMINKNNHALDDCKYFINSKAHPVNRKIKIPSLISSYRSGGKTLTALNPYFMR